MVQWGCGRTVFQYEYRFTPYEGSFFVLEPRGPSLAGGCRGCGESDWGLPRGRAWPRRSGEQQFGQDSGARAGDGVVFDRAKCEDD